MNKTSISLIITLIFCSMTISLSFPVQSVDSSSHVINITEVNNSYQIKELISISPSSLTTTSTYLVQIPSAAFDDISFIIDNTQITAEEQENKIYVLDLNSSLFSANKITVEITYYLSTTINLFEKTFLENSSDVEIIFENTKIFESNKQRADTTIHINIEQPIQPDSFNLYTIILIVLLLVIIIVTSYYGFFKRKNGKHRKRHFESSELLEIEKDLLLSMLKDIEKLHRNQKISDDSYHKLKSYYKQQTVEIMSNLEEQNK